MKKGILWLTQTALMLALLVTLQFITKPLGQIVTGSCVNAVLALSVLLCGMSSGVVIALLSPLFAFFLNIAPNLVTVPAIMAGNGIFVLVLGLLCAGEKPLWKQLIGLAAAAAAKFAVLYLLVVVVICGLLLETLKGQGLAVPVAVLTVNFSWPQLITALVGGVLALLIAPPVKKAIHKK